MKEREEKSVLSIELLINGDWIGRILSGIMMTGIVRHFVYRNLICNITAPLFVFVSLPNYFVYNGVQRWNNARARKIIMENVIIIKWAGVEGISLFGRD